MHLEGDNAREPPVACVRDAGRLVQVLGDDGVGHGEEEGHLQLRILGLDQVEQPRDSCTPSTSVMLSTQKTQSTSPLHNK